jgi:DNA polymerase V
MNNNQTPSSKRGGYRPGAGRKPGSGPFRELTKPVRVPESQVPTVLSFLQAFRDRHSEAPTLGEIYSPALNQRTVRRPLFSSRIQAGFPSPADDYVAQQLDLHELLVKREAATFYVRVKGDSMLGASIQEGDILVVDRSVEPTDGKIVIAVLNGELTVKELSRKKDRIQLLPRNDSYPPIEITSESDLTIWGVVTGVVRQI